MEEVTSAAAATHNNDNDTNSNENAGNSSSSSNSVTTINSTQINGTNDANNNDDNGNNSLKEGRGGNNKSDYDPTTTTTSTPPTNGSSSSSSHGGEDGSGNRQHSSQQPAPVNGEVVAVVSPAAPPASANNGGGGGGAPIGAVPPPPPAPPPGPPQRSRKEVAIAAAGERMKNCARQEDALWISAEFLNASELVSMACVSKYFNSRVRRTAAWRRIVLNLEKTLRGHVGRVTALASLENHVFSGSTDGKIKAWDTRSWTCTITRDLTPAAGPHFTHPRVASKLHAPLVPGSLQPNSSSSSSSSGMYQQQHHAQPPTQSSSGGAAEEEYPDYPLAITTLASAPGVVLCGTEDGAIKLWWVHEKRDDKITFPPLKHKGAVTSIITVEDRFFFSGSAEGYVAKGNLRSPPGQANFVPDHNLRYAGQMVTALALSHGCLFAGLVDGTIHVYVANTMSTKLKLQNHKDRITALVAAHQRGKDYVFSASWDCTVSKYDAESLNVIRTVPLLPVGICWSLAVRRDAHTGTQTLVAGCRDGDVVLMSFGLELLSGMEANSWAYRNDHHKNWVKAVLALPDGRIVSGSDDWTCKVWNYRGYARPMGFRDFYGLPVGRLSEEDLDLIMREMRKKNPNSGALSESQIQDLKVKADINREARLQGLTTTEREAELERERLMAEQWKLARNNRATRLKIAAGEAAAVGNVGNMNGSSSAPAATSAPANEGVVAPASSAPAPIAKGEGHGSALSSSSSSANAPSSIASAKEVDNRPNKAASNDHGNGSPPASTASPPMGGPSPTPQSVPSSPLRPGADESASSSAAAPPPTTANKTPPLPSQAAEAQPPLEKEKNAAPVTTAVPPNAAVDSSSSADPPAPDPHHHQQQQQPTTSGMTRTSSLRSAAGTMMRRQSDEIGVVSSSSSSSSSTTAPASEEREEPPAPAEDIPATKTRSTRSNKGVATAASAVVSPAANEPLTKRRKTTRG